MARAIKPDGGDRSSARPPEAVRSDILRQGVTRQRRNVQSPMQCAGDFSIMEALGGLA